MNLNKVMLIGRIGRQPELRFTPDGKQVCTTTLAANRRWKEGDNLKEATDWINLEAWNAQAKTFSDFLVPGRLVYIEGRIHTDVYESNGATKYWTKVIVQDFRFLDNKQAEPASEDIPF